MPRPRPQRGFGWGLVTRLYTRWFTPVTPPTIYRTNLTLSTHLEVIEGKSKMKNFHKLLRNSLGERDREKAQLTEFSELS